MSETDEVTLYDRTLSDEEVNDLEAFEESPARVSYSTQDYPIDGLVKRLQNRSMLVPQFGKRDEDVQTVGFQRGFVWTKGQMDKFIESLLLGYPIPGIFLIRQSSDKRMLVLDGQQRLETLRRFYENDHDGKPFSLQNVGQQFKGLQYKTLGDDLRRELDDSYIQATIVATDGSNEVDDAIYQIFERLNSGGTQLTPHEIRVALYAGVLVEAVEVLNDNSAWRALYGSRSKRVRDHELILRILALHERADEYERPLKKFLNDFAKDYRTRDVATEPLGILFQRAAEDLAHFVGVDAFRSMSGTQVNAAQAEAVMVAMMRAREAIVGPPGDLRANIERLRADPNFQSFTRGSTADPNSVDGRLRMATDFITGTSEADT